MIKGQFISVCVTHEGEQTRTVPGTPASNTVTNIEAVGGGGGGYWWYLNSDGNVDVGCNGGGGGDYAGLPNVAPKTGDTLTITVGAGGVGTLGVTGSGTSTQLVNQIPELTFPANGGSSYVVFDGQTIILGFGGISVAGLGGTPSPSNDIGINIACGGASAGGAGGAVTNARAASGGGAGGLYGYGMGGIAVGGAATAVASLGGGAAQGDNNTGTVVNHQPTGGNLGTGTGGVGGYSAGVTAGGYTFAQTKGTGGLTGNNPGNAGTLGGGGGGGGAGNGNGGLGSSTHHWGTLGSGSGAATGWAAHGSSATGGSPGNYGGGAAAQFNGDVTGVFANGANGIVVVTIAPDGSYSTTQVFFKTPGTVEWVVP